MKKFLLSTSAVLVMVLMLASCSSNSPKSVANTWLTSFYRMDYEAAKKVSTDDTKKLLDMLSQFSAMMPDSTKTQMKKTTVNIKDVKETGDKALVTYTVSSEPKDQTLNLVKTNGKWLVQFTKNDQGGGNSTPADANQAPMSNDTSSTSMPADTSAPVTPVDSTSATPAK